MIQAIIFDMDGTLVNSIPAHFKKYKLIFKEELNFNLTKKDFLTKYNGSNTTEIYRKVLKVCESKKPLSYFIKKNDHINKTELVDKVRLFPYVKKILIELKKRNIQLAIASSSKRTIVNKILKNNNIYDYFDEIICGDDVSRAKPDPKIFLKARELLGSKKKGNAHC